jgi:hypothetical protein
MTNGEWAIVEKRLEHVGHPVRFLCDGQKVVYVLGQVSKMKLAIVGFRGFKISKETLLKGSHEEDQRFCRPRDIYQWEKSSRQALLKMNRFQRKELCISYGLDSIDPNEKIKFYTPFWNSFKALKAHLLKNNKEIILAADQSTAADQISEDVKAEGWIDHEERENEKGTDHRI